MSPLVDVIRRALGDGSVELGMDDVEEFEEPATSNGWTLERLLARERQPIPLEIPDWYGFGDEPTAILGIVIDDLPAEVCG